MGLAGLVLLASCGKDDEPRVPDPIEGTWKLDAFTLTDLPVGFESYEGLVLNINQLTTWDDYEITFVEDNTYKRRVYLPGSDALDNGTWAKDGDELTLTPDDDDFEDIFTIENNDEIELVLSEGIRLSLVPDVVYDTLTEEYASSLTNAELDAVLDGTRVDVNLLLNYVFEK